MNYRPTATGLLIPVRMNEDARYLCHWPGCDWRGYTPREQIAHIKEHVRENEAEIVEATTPYVEQLMGEGGDPEHQDYLERKYKQMVRDVGPKEALRPDRY